MHKYLLLSLLLILTLNIQAKVELHHQGSAIQLFVNNQPMLILGGELSNSAATSVADIDSILPRIHSLGLNTVFIPIQWNLLEPQEGHFDYTLVDAMILQARTFHLHLVLLWFGAWKNSMSCYAPLWFKENIRRFPRAMTATGKPMEIATAFSDQVLKADKTAFTHLMQHLKDTDSKKNTVIMIQIENEIGMLEAARDHSPLAEKAYKHNYRKWTDDEEFQAYYYAHYVEQLAHAGKAIYPLPMYVNAAMNSRGRKPGEYPSAGPLAHLLPIWKQTAPDIDIYAPDIYDTGFADWVARYKRPDNPFFTPETQLGTYSGVRALYCFGEVDAMGFSPFAIDQAPQEVASHITQAYGILRQLSPLLLKAQGTAHFTHINSSGICQWSGSHTWGLLFDREHPERIIHDGNVVITCKHYYTLPWDVRAANGTPWPESGGLILRLAPYDYLIAGNGIVAVFQTLTEKQQEQQMTNGEDGFATKSNDRPSKNNKFYGHRLGIASVDQVRIDSTGNLQYIRQDNGDQDHQGRHARISCDEYKILHVKLYEY